MSNNTRPAVVCSQVADTIGLYSTLIHPGSSGDPVLLSFNDRLALAGQLQTLRFRLLSLSEELDISPTAAVERSSMVDRHL